MKESVFSESLLEKIEHVPLLVDYFATCGIKQNKLLKYIETLKDKEEDKISECFDSEVLKENKLKPELTSRYPPIDKPSFPFPSRIENFCFSLGFKISHESSSKISSFVLTTEGGERTYVV